MGIIGAAGIAGTALAVPAQSVDEVDVVGVTSRDPQRAREFATRYGLEKVYPSYGELLDDSSLDAVYVPLANSLHAKWTIAALEAGHHVLCEKPLGSNAAQAEEMVATAERQGRMMVEAFHWRYHPVAGKMIALSKQIGPLERLEARFLVHIDPPNVRWDLELAGGSLMDLGCYCVHMVRTVAGSEPKVLRAAAVEGPRGVDVTMEADLEFAGGLPATISSSMVANESVWPEAMTFRAVGREGEVEILNPMAPQLGHRVTATLADGTKVNEVLDTPTSYVHQLRAFCRIISGEEAPLTGGQDSIDNMKVIDAIYEASGLGMRN
ncbi:MAG TPA: Gfo/Idh/MocA family oxidoreductase [Acidimicrobiales bacterium]|nr:Gfo/Idh/MocA family oxidoreductase [Acidimicrobiales bacterium]